MFPTNAAHWHLVLNHLPVIGMLFGVIAILLSFMSSHIAVKRLALGLVLLAGLFSIPASRSGENAEEFLENQPGFSESIAHDHEEAAEAANVAALVTAGLALLVLIWSIRVNKLSNVLVVIVLLAGFVSLGLMGRAANLGGKIKHPEISETQSPTLQPPPAKDDD